MTPRAAFACALVVTLLASAALVAQAQTPPPTIEPDRPDVTNGPHLVGVGTVQFELGGIYTRDRSQQYVAAAPATVRIGVLSGLEARLGVDNQFAASSEDNTGLGTIQAGAKVRVWSNSRGAALVSILPTIVVPASGGAPDLWAV